MRVEKSRNAERYAAAGCIALGLVLSVVLAPKNSFFAATAAFYWASQLAVLVFVWLFRSRPAVVAGVAVALAAYLASFSAWVFTRPTPDSMVWLGYISSLPGALIGAVGAAYLLRRAGLRAFIAGAVAAGAVLIGVALNLVALCSTVMQCSVG